jgi:predicted Zn-dependent protease
MSGRRAALLLGVAVGCAGNPPDPGPPYVPDLRDYRAFQERWSEVLLEPNYLPFMAHRMPARQGEGEWLVFCRWPPEAMPIAVRVEPPRIPESLQREFSPRTADSYVSAVEEALSMWERDLEGLVRFRRVASREEAMLTLRLVPEEAPTPDPDLQVLGTTPVARSCRSRGYDAETDRLLVDFRVPEVRLYIADRFGLLDAEQVEWVALHEIGHALGMRGHSPIPADLMYEVVRDRVIVRELSTEDVNSFVSLYQLPNGTVFGRIPPGGAPARAPPAGPSGPPELELAPHVDPRLGFSWRPPAGWLRVETARGVVAVDGVTWQYTASFQVIVERYATIEDYLERYGLHYLRRGRVLELGPASVSERRALRAVVEDSEGGNVEHLAFVESGDGRVLVVVADCPADLADAYRPWFEAALGSLRVWGAPGPGDPGAGQR